MTHADAFLQDILAHPDDDTPRLIFADWLEERGDAASAARAEFIRVQCALSTKTMPSSVGSDLRRREARLLKKHEKQWASQVSRFASSWIFRRGFIEEISTSVMDFLHWMEYLFSSAPIRHLHVHIEEDRWPSEGMVVLADCPQLAGLRSFNLSGNHLNSTDIAALSVCEHLTEMTALDLSGNNFGDRGLSALIRAPFFPRLTYLNLRQNDVGSLGVRLLTSALRQLAESPDGLRMLRLELGDNRRAAAARRTLAAVPQLRRVVRW